MPNWKSARQTDRTPPDEHPHPDQVPLRILIVSPWVAAGTGGVETTTRMLTGYLTGAGHDVITLAPPGPAAGTGADWPSRLDSRPMRSPVDRDHPIRSRLAYLVTAPADVSRIRRFLREERIDVVNIHYPLGLFTNVALACIGGPPLVVSAHGSDLRAAPEIGPLESGVKTTIRIAKAIISPSRSFAEQIAADVPRSAGKLEVVPHGVVVPGEGGADAPWPRPYVLSVGGLKRVKNLGMLIAAFRRVATRIASVDLIIAGTGPLLGELSDLAASLGIADRVRFEGGLPPAAIDRWQRHARLVVAPSPAETFGLAAAESMARGRPVVAASEGALSDLVEDGVTGLLASAANPEAFAAAIERLLVDPMLADALGRAGRATIRERFTPAAMVAGYERVFASVLEPSGGSSTSKTRLKFAPPTARDGRRD